VQACKSAIQHNPIIKAYARKLYERGKHKGIVMNNVKNKLIHVIFKMIQTQTCWNPNYQKTHINENARDLKENEKGATEVISFIG